METATTTLTSLTRRLANATAAAVILPMIAAVTSAAAVNVTASGGNDDSQSAFNCSMEYVECRASRWLYVSLCPLMLAAGTVGNLLLVLTMTTYSMRNTAFGVLVASLAVVDAIALWSALVRHFIKGVLLYDIREAGVWSCRLHRYIVYSSIDSSAWILVALAAGRLASVSRPESSIRRGRRGAVRARLAVLLIVAAQLAWNAPILWMFGEVRSPEDGSLLRNCGYPDAASAYYWTHVQPYIALSLASVAPFVLMLAINGAIVAALRSRSEKALGVYRVSRLGQGADGLSLSESSRAKATMLLVVSFLFLVTTVPTFVQTAIERTLQGDGRSWARHELVDTITTLMLYTNSATNFFGYCLSGRMFRQHCYAVLAALRDRQRCCRLHSSTEGSQPLSGRASGNTSSAAVPMLPRSVLALRDIGTWTRSSAPSSATSSSCGSSPESTPQCSPAVHRSPRVSGAAERIAGRQSLGQPIG